jgi:hypothetical protein
MVGQTISHYRIVSQLGAGGMGIVYHAEDLRLGRPVALKFLSEELSRDMTAVDRLRLEARAASALNHGNICTIYDIDEYDGQPFIAMELMRGQSLRERLASGGVRIHQVVDIAIQVADALDAAYSLGIVHRDIKPANIFLTERGHVKVLDFGLAKLTAHHGESATTGAQDLTQEGVALGTIAYMSPEQVTGDELDGRSDIFSLGVVLYECVTGRQPFTGKTSAVVLAAILNRAPVSPIVFNPDLPLRLQEVISNCLEKDRELRYQSAADLRADLKRVRRDIESGHSIAMTVPAPDQAGAIPTPPGRQSGRPPSAAAQAAQPAPVRRGRWLLPAAAAGVVALLGVAAFEFYGRAPAGDPPASSGTAPASPSTPSTTADAVAPTAGAAASSPGAGAAMPPVPSAGPSAAPPPEPAAVPSRDRGAATATGRGAAIAPTERDARRAEPPGRPPAATAIPPPITATDRPPLTTTNAPGGSGTGAPAPAAPPAQPPVNQTPAPQTAPLAQSTLPLVPPPPVDQPLPSPAAAPPSPASAAVTPPKPTPSAPTTSAPAPAAAPRAAEDDEAAIRRVVATYGRAIETKDLNLFRSVKPNLSREEERRLEAGFRAVTSQRVSLTVVNVERKGQEASVTVRRRDTIDAGGRQQTADTQQMLRLSHASGNWVIVDIR